MKTWLASLLLIMLLSISCSKNNKQEEAPVVDATSQFAIVVLGIEETNHDQGVALITICQSPDRKFTVQAYTYTYAEKDSRKIGALCDKFYVHLTARDSMFSRYKTLEEYCNGIFRSGENFKKQGTIANNQLYNLYNSKTISLAYNKLPASENGVLKAFASLFPTATAQEPSPAYAFLNSYAAVLGGYLSAPMRSFKLIPTTALGTLYSTLMSYTTGSAIIADVVVTGAVTSLSRGGMFLGVYLGANQLADAHRSLWINDVLKALSNGNYVPEDKQYASVGDILTGLEKHIQAYLDRDKGLCVTKSITTGSATGITATEATLEGEVNITCNGGGSYGYSVICISKTPEGLSIYNPGTPVMDRSGKLTAKVTGLSPSTAYYYQTYHFSVYDGGRQIPYGAGQIKRFTTKEEPLMQGDSCQGGIVVYLDENGQHGLIAAMENQSNGIPWDPNSITSENVYDPKKIGGTSTAMGTGSANTGIINGALGATGNAASVCRKYTGGGYSDWFLPSMDELYKLLPYWYVLKMGEYSYWSSSEYIGNFTFGSSGAGVMMERGGAVMNKNPGFAVRAVRSF